MGWNKSDRFQEFLKRLEQASAAHSHDAAFALLCDTLNQVEDEFSDIVCRPENWQSDGRMYPPEIDNARDVEGRSDVIRYRHDVIRYRHKAHNTFIRDNGAIEIREENGLLLFEKAGSDGRGVDLVINKK